MFSRTTVRVLLAAALAAMLCGAARADATLPTGLAPGSKYEIMFVTLDHTTGTSSNISDYNSFVTTEANQSATLAALGVTWTAFASTSGYNAKTYGYSSYPIYNTSGGSLEPNYLTLFSDNSFPGPTYNQFGNSIYNYTQASQRDVWTGTSPSSWPSGVLGTANPIDGVDSGTNLGWYYYSFPVEGNSYLMYGISSPITAVPEPATVTLLGTALLGLGVAYLRRRAAKA